MRAFLLASLLLLMPTSAFAIDLTSPDDATLHAVTFHDAKEGWAVGDEGVIWHTIDGGSSWERQSSGTRASLRSVQFLDDATGWAVGREERPLNGGSVGVVLFTRDGGVRWQRLLDNALPGLNAIRFTDRKTGLLMGDGVDPFPTGLFRTNDGGKSWEPVKGYRTPSWTAGDFQDDKNGVLVGPWGRLASFRHDQWATADTTILGHRGLRAVQILPKRLLAVGEGGMVLTSASAGSAWGHVDLKLPPAVRACLDLNAIAAFDERVWVAGRPGSVILASEDGGANWSLKPTGQSLPLHGLAFVDKNNGWAVGVGGVILKTTDSGTTWAVQKQGSKRSPLLCVQSKASDVPLDTFAALAGADGFHAVALAMNGDDPASAAWSQVRMGSRLHQAVRAVGGLAAEQCGLFPLPQYLEHSNQTEILQSWNAAHGGEASRELVRHLVLSLRMWRPQVVITDSVTGPAAGALLAEALTKAVELAGDPQAFPEQITTLGLTAWRTRTLFAMAPSGEGRITLDNTLTLAALEGTPREAAFLAQSLLSDKVLSLPTRRSYQPIGGQPGARIGNNLLEGVAVAVGEGRRAVVETKDDDKNRGALQASRQIVNLVEKLPRTEMVLTQLVPLLTSLPEDAAAQAAFTIANSYVRMGEWDLARETFLVLVDRSPAHPLSAEAYRWLVMHNASSEVRRRYDLKQFALVKPADDFRPLLVKKTPNVGDIHIQPAAAIDVIGSTGLSLLGSHEETRQWNKGSLEISKRLVGFGSLAATDPRVQFSLQSAKRNLGNPGEARDWYARFASHVTKGPWAEASGAELWLNGTGPKPRRVAPCRLAQQRPHLDGKLDDLCWKDQAPLPLTDAAGSTQADSATEAWLAYDAEFLYVALRCKHPESRNVTPIKIRQRDANLDSQDRVSLLLDLDRDYATYFRLEVDERGCVREDCWGDRSWNPKWYVAVHTTDEAWQVEAAIPLGELTSQRVTLDTRWACNLVRILPGRGVQSYSRPADVHPRPEGMCVLTFQQDARKAAPPMPTVP